MWERYCRAVSAIVYVVDAADHNNLSISKSELHDLLSKPALIGIPLLVLGNKIDKAGALSKDSLMDQISQKDAKKRSPADENYDPRTLYLPHDFPQSLSGCQRQWWEFKSKHMDKVLFFKVF